jgi:hypothetical protein
MSCEVRGVRGADRRVGRVREVPQMLLDLWIEGLREAWDMTLTLLGVRDW